MRPRVERLFQYVANEVGHDPGKLGEYVPILEFICRQYLPAWLMLAELYEETGLPEALSRAKDAIRGLLERASDLVLQKSGWEALARLCQRTQDWLGETQALLGLSNLSSAAFSSLSNAANRLNELFRDRLLVLDSEEKRIIVQELVDRIEQRAGEANATDLSRLAWLCLHLRNEDRAREYTKRGLSADRQNTHCVKLAQRFGLL